MLIPLAIRLNCNLGLLSQLSLCNATRISVPKLPGLLYHDKSLLCAMKCVLSQHSLQSISQPDSVRTRCETLQRSHRPPNYIRVRGEARKGQDGEVKR